MLFHRRHTSPFFYVVILICLMLFCLFSSISTQHVRVIFVSFFVFFSGISFVCITTEYFVENHFMYSRSFFCSHCQRAKKTGEFEVVMFIHQTNNIMNEIQNYQSAWTSIYIIYIKTYICGIKCASKREVSFVGSCRLKLLGS